MKLQRLKSRTRGEATYHKWLVNLPSKAIQEVGWTEGDDLAVEVRDGTLVLRKP